MIRYAIPVLGLLVACASSVWAEDKPAGPDRAELEKQFSELMSNCTMVGRFTDSNTPDKAPREERYTLGEVKKVQGDTWLFPARIQYGDHDVTLPIPLEVKWAGDTPVITLTKMPIPGFGVFTARVLIYDGQYTGTWSGANHGGHLFGRIERAKKDAPAEKDFEKK